MPGPLEGYRIIDLCRAGPGRQATGILADYGAEVVSVVQPGYAQRAAPGEGGMRRGDAINQRNKRSLFLNMRSEGALGRFQAAGRTIGCRAGKQPARGGEAPGR